jgi:hypothetical protein
MVCGCIRLYAFESQPGLAACNHGTGTADKVIPAFSWAGQDASAVLISSTTSQQSEQCASSALLPLFKRVLLACRRDICKNRVNSHYDGNLTGPHWA